MQWYRECTSLNPGLGLVIDCQHQKYFLTDKREKQITPLTNNVNKLLHQVGMPNAKIKVTIDEVPYHLFGKDKVDILFDANNTQKFEPIKKVASGGELSRLMLCIKSLVAICCTRSLASNVFK